MSWGSRGGGERINQDCYSPDCVRCGSGDTLGGEGQVEEGVAKRGVIGVLVR